ncbi:MAG: hypothetical protein NT159_10615 [Proteobacteria bacterium]|nr:hypothetical protein [Pseudomonadota bacterium]
MHPNLSFEQAPPISVPYRFFLTAPWFGVTAGLLLAWLGPDALESRWSPGALALSHLLTVGFMLQVMCGALLQFIPVATGGNVWRPRWVASLVHPIVAIAALCLAFGFALSQPLLIQIAVPLFAAGLGGFIAVVSFSLLRTPAHGMTIHVLRLALFGLAVTLILGIALASALGWQADGQASWSLVLISNVHAAWGLGAWALMLVIGVSYLVVPMFQLTPSYPAWLTRTVPFGILVAIGLWSLQLGVDGELVQSWLSVVALGGMLLAGLYAGTTLWLQALRRRRLTDITFVFWRGAMLALLGFVASWIALEVFPVLGEHPRAAIWLGMLALPGVFVSVISGMLYKIVPFLNWLHLQRLGGLKVLPPNIKQMLAEKPMRRQMRLHFASLVLLLGAVLWPPLTSLAGLSFAVSFLWLEWNLVGAVRRYIDFRSRALSDQVIDQTHADASSRVS